MIESKEILLRMRESKSEIHLARNRIGDRLLQKGFVTREIVDKAVKRQRSDPPAGKRKLGDILIEDFNVNRHVVYREIAEMYAFKEVDLSNGALNDENVSVIKQFHSRLSDNLKEDIKKLLILPYRTDPDNKYILYIAAADPTRLEIPVIASALGYTRYESHYCQGDILQTVIEKILPAQNEYLKDYENTIDELEDSTEGSMDINEVELDTEIHTSKLTNLVEGCFVEAVRCGASDIHIIPKTGRLVEFYFRIDGKLRLWKSQSCTKAESIAAVVKDRSRNINRFERDSAQDGFFQRTIDGAIIRFRVSILPVVCAEYERKLESIVVRILDDRKIITDFKQLGLLEKAMKDFTKAISKPQGLVILTGPTGSGKSTTLMAALCGVMTGESNVLTVEDPVEYLISGSRQLKINPKMDFDQAMRSILRHDPDIVMVGEMRDRITAEISFKLANTGHLTFSTLHTNDAVSVISRLYKLGIEPFLIAYAVNIVIAQRLVRKLCEHCKAIDATIGPEIPLSIGFTEKDYEKIDFFKPAGCDECHSGFSGRLAIHEALMFTDEIRKAIFAMSENIDECRIRDLARNDGMLSLCDSGLDRIRNGETTCAEIAFATGGKS